MITVKQAAENWGMSVRNVQDLCKRGRIEGAKRIGRDWMIPEAAARPSDARRVSGYNKPLIRKTPFLDMTDLYDVAGSADECALRIESGSESRRLFDAEISYLRGDIAMWNVAKRHISEAPCKSAADHDIIALSLAATDSMLRRTDEYPDWFLEGCFDRLHPDAHPAARVYYVKYLLVKAYDLAIKKTIDNEMHGLALMRTLPYLIEPMISQAVADNTVLVEIYLRLLCAVVYLQCENKIKAARHLDIAIELCLKDGLYIPLVEYRRQLGAFLDDRIACVSDEDAKKVKDMHKKLYTGWVELYNEVSESRMESSLSTREREVARLVAYGCTNQEIANKLCISAHTVRALVNSIKNKTGAVSRMEICDYI